MRGRVLLVGAAALAGCTVGPNYRPPEMAPETGPRFAEAAPDPATMPQPPAVDLARWWEAFGDVELNRLITLALKDAPDILTAQSRVREARLSIVTARSAGLPSVDASGSAQAQKLSHGHATIHAGELGELGQTLNGGQTVSTSFSGKTIQTYQAGFDATWEIDLFGGNRRQVEAARAQAQAAEFNAADAAVTLSAEIAADYLQLRLAQQRFHVTEAEIARQQRSLEILSDTAKVGLVPQTNYTRQRTQLATAQAQLPPLVAEAKAQLHAIAILTGHPPAELDAETAADHALTEPQPIPPGLPSELLLRRPDVRAAERQLAAATAGIGVATADLYPRITLTGMATLISYALGNIANAHGLQTTGAGQGSFPVFDFGARRATVDIRREEAEQAYQSYRQTVLGALRDVEDALGRIASDDAQLQVLRAGVDDAARSEQSARAQFGVGLQSFDAVLSTQAQVLTINDQLVQAESTRRQDVVSLYKALGGGWNPQAPTDVPDRPARPFDAATARRSQQ